MKQSPGWKVDLLTKPFPNRRTACSGANDRSTVGETTAATPIPTRCLPAIHVDEAQIHAHLDGVVRQTVQDTLNALVDAVTDELYGACAGL
jgi:hypothetical protein